MPKKAGKKGGGKGKGKKGKKDNLTEEQKKKLAEQKALAEQEKITRRREVTNAFLKLKKEKEYELIKLNTNKLLDLWRPRLRKLKVEELMDDYKMMRNAFERAFDKKHNLMKDLKDALENNQKDYDAAVDSHMYNIDKMMEFYKKRLEEVRDSYHVERKKLVQQLNDERFNIQSYQDRSLRQLKNSMNKISNHFKDQSADAEADFSLRGEEIRNKGIEEIHIVKSKMDQRMNEMWKELHDRLVAYDVNVNSKRGEYLEYREKDLVMSSLIDSQFRRLYSLQEGIAQMTQKTDMFDKALEHFLGQLYKKKKEYRTVYDGHMTHHREITSVSSSAVRQLALTTRLTHEKMDEMLGQRERLLKTIERCRKRERMDEKIDPFLLKWSLNNMIADDNENVPGHKCDTGAQADAAESEANLAGKYTLHVKGIVHDLTCDCNPCTCEIDGEGRLGLMFPAQKLVEEFSILERFWIRYNRVSLERAALGVRRQALLKDNYKLKLALRNYMGGMNPLSQDVCNFHEEALVNTNTNTNSNLNQFPGYPDIPVSGASLSPASSMNMLNIVQKKREGQYPISLRKPKISAGRIKLKSIHSHSDSENDDENEYKNDDEDFEASQSQSHPHDKDQDQDKDSESDSEKEKLRRNQRLKHRLSLIQPRFIRPPSHGTNVTEAVQYIRTVGKSATNISQNPYYLTRTGIIPSQQTQIFTLPRLVRIQSN